MAEKDSAAAVAAAAEHARFVFDHSIVGMAVVDLEGRYLRVNRALCEMLGRAEPELLTTTWQDVTHPDDLAAGEAFVARARTGRAEVFTTERRYVRPDGRTVWVLLAVLSLDGSDAEPVGFFSQAWDITDRKVAEQAQTRLAAIVESCEDAMVGTDPDGIVVSWNPAAEQLFGYPAEEVVGRHFGLLIPADGRDEAAGLMARVMAGERVRHHETDRVRKDGRVVTVALSLSAVRDPAGGVVGLSAVCRDITVEKQAERRLVRMAFRDQLTGVHNRRGFTEGAAHGLALAAGDGRGVALLFIDIDDMKHINDTLGHAAGDRALCDVAALLKTTFREADLVGRWAGDEFCVLITDADHDAAAFAAERLRRAVDARNADAGAGDRLRVTVGGAWSDPRAPCSLEQLVARADAAMYATKGRGADRPRLLVVEDNTDIRGLIVAVLADAYEVVETGCSEDALARLAAEPFDAVVLDLHLPGVDGLEVARTTKTDPATSRTPILVLTADPNQEAAALRVGVDDYLAKPFDPAVLRLRLRRLLRPGVRPPTTAPLAADRALLANLTPVDRTDHKLRHA